MPNRYRLIIAGPNGAGKTTFAKAFLPHAGDCFNLINADLIAAGQAAGYSVDSIFLKLRSLKCALARVDARVPRGGHHIPPR